MLELLAGCSSLIGEVGFTLGEVETLLNLRETSCGDIVIVLYAVPPECRGSFC